MNRTLIIICIYTSRICMLVFHRYKFYSMQIPPVIFTRRQTTTYRSCFMAFMWIQKLIRCTSANCAISCKAIAFGRQTIVFVCYACICVTSECTAIPINSACLVQIIIISLVEEMSKLRKCWLCFCYFVVNSALVFLSFSCDGEEF